MNRTFPEWKIPSNLQDLISEDEDLTWETDKWEPISLSVMAGTSYAGRDIPLSWEILFDPFEEDFAIANKKLEREGIEPDGEGWSGYIFRAFEQAYPDLTGELRDDSETSTCVIWVESEETCERLIQVVWSLIFGDGGMS